MSEHRDDAMLVRLPGGSWLASSLVHDESPPRHVYRVISPAGGVLSEHGTLRDLIDGLADRSDP